MNRQDPKILVKLMYLNYLRDFYKTLFGKEIPRNELIFEYLENEFPELYELKRGYLFEINPFIWTHRAQNLMIKKSNTLLK
jgi:hypothetical protein